MLAASDTETYNFSVDKCVVFEGDNNNHPFSHTRVYAVAAGSSQLLRRGTELCDTCRRWQSVYLWDTHSNILS